MLSFKDFLAVSSTGESELQDLNAKKRHRAVDMYESPAHAAVHTDYSHLKQTLPNTPDKYEKIHAALKQKHGSAADQYFSTDKAPHTSVKDEECEVPTGGSGDPVDPNTGTKRMIVGEAAHPFTQGQVVGKTDLGRSRGWKYSRSLGASSTEFIHPQHGSVIAHVAKEDPHGKTTHYKIHSIRTHSGRLTNPPPDHVYRRSLGRHVKNTSIYD